VSLGRLNAGGDRPGALWIPLRPSTIDKASDPEAGLLPIDKGMHPRVEAVLDLCGLVRVAEHPELATTLRRLVAAGELARPFPANARIRVGGRLVVGDVLFVEERLILEVDGFEYHSAAGDFQRDRERQNLLTLAGYRVLRFTWDQLEHPDDVLGQVRWALRGRNS